MHRLVAGAGPNDVVDHHNRDTLDNRLANLRITGRPGNGANSVGQRRKRGKSSNYKGVFWDKARGRWMATIHTGGRTRSLGRYALEIDAARAYDLAAVEAWGSMARTNFPTEGAGGDLVDIAS